MIFFSSVKIQHNQKPLLFSYSMFIRVGRILIGQHFVEVTLYLIFLSFSCGMRLSL